MAISPVQAARCLQETVRTQAFLQGISAAIKNKLAQHNVVNILYAGTGPYGLLLLPLLAILKDKRISATLIDIHPENISALKTVITALEIDEYITQIEVADATTWQAENNETYDLIISETMNTLLKCEPQITIFSHLQQFLKPDGQLIPQRIKIGAQLIAAESEQKTSELSDSDHIQKILPAIDLGCFFQCDKNSTAALHNGEMGCLTGEINLPEAFNTRCYKTLRFTTTIDVYADHHLTENQCSLNMPIFYHDLKLQVGGSIHYEYQLTNNPSFIFDFPLMCLSRELPSIHEVGDLKIIHLKRFWHKSQLTRANLLNTEIKQFEWSLDTHLLELLGLSTLDTISYLYQQQPEFSEFEEWLLAEATSSSFINNPEHINAALLQKRIS